MATDKVDYPTAYARVQKDEKFADHFTALENASGK